MGFFKKKAKITRGRCNHMYQYSLLTVKKKCFCFMPFLAVLFQRDTNNEEFNGCS